MNLWLFIKETSKHLLFSKLFNYYADVLDTWTGKISVL